MDRTDRILPVVIEGEPHASDPRLECFPPALRHPLSAPEADANVDVTRRASLPLWADFRGMGGKIPIVEDKHPHHVLETKELRLIAGLLGITFEDLVQRDRKRQLQEARRPGIVNLDVKRTGARVEISEASPSGSTGTPLFGSFGGGPDVVNLANLNDINLGAGARDSARSVAG